MHRSAISERIRRLTSLGNRSIDAIALTPSSMRRIALYALLTMLLLALVHVPVADNIQPPEMLSYEAPTSPEGVSLSDVARDVLIKVFINEDGSVVRAELQRSCGDGLLDTAALDAARDYEFLPERRNGKAVPVWISFRIQFLANTE